MDNSKWTFLRVLFLLSHLTLWDLGESLDFEGLCKRGSPNSIDGPCPWNNEGRFYYSHIGHFLSPRHYRGGGGGTISICCNTRVLGPGRCSEPTYVPHGTPCPSGQFEITRWDLEYGGKETQLLICCDNDIRLLNPDGNHATDEPPLCNPKTEYHQIHHEISAGLRTFDACFKNYDESSCIVNHEREIDESCDLKNHDPTLTTFPMTQYWLQGRVQKKLSEEFPLLLGYLNLCCKPTTGPQSSSQNVVDVKEIFSKPLSVDRPSENIVGPPETTSNACYRQPLNEPPCDPSTHVQLDLAQDRICCKIIKHHEKTCSIQKVPWETFCEGPEDGPTSNPKKAIAGWVNYVTYEDPKTNLKTLGRVAYCCESPFGKVTGPVQGCSSAQGFGCPKWENDEHYYVGAFEEDGRGHSVCCPSGQIQIKPEAPTVSPLHSNNAEVGAPLDALPALNDPESESPLYPEESSLRTSAASNQFEIPTGTSTFNPPVPEMSLDLFSTIETVENLPIQIPQAVSPTKNSGPPTPRRKGRRKNGRSTSRRFRGVRTRKRLGSNPRSTQGHRQRSTGKSSPKLQPTPAAGSTTTQWTPLDLLYNLLPGLQSLMSPLTGSTSPQS